MDSSCARVMQLFHHYQIQPHLSHAKILLHQWYARGLPQYIIFPPPHFLHVSEG